MSSRFITPFADYGNGISPSDGAKLFFYEAGTTTPKDTFSDQLSTPTPNANPVISDATGVFGDIYISGLYDVVLKDKNDVQIFPAAKVSEFVTGSGQLENVLSRDTLNAAVIDTSLQSGLSINIAERTTGDGGGGMWDVVLSSAVTENTFNIVQCTGVPTLSLVLRYDLPVVGDKSGADNTGVIDSTAALDEDNYTLHSKVHLGDGLFKMNKWMDSGWLVGNGYSTLLKPFSDTTNDGFVLSLGASALPFGHFDTRVVRDMAIDGETGGCIRFDDETDVDGADLSSVSWLLDNLTLRSLPGGGGGICVKSEFGTIGDIFNNVSIYGSDFGYWLQNNQFALQHTGANTWNTNHMQRCELAAVYLNDSGAGRGNHVLNQCIIENNHGFGIFAKSDGHAISTGPLMLNNVWFEHNGLSATPLIPNHTVDIDSVTYTPRDMRFENFGSIVLNGVHVKELEVVSSDVACYDTRHDNDQYPAHYSVTADSNSTITTTNPSGGNQFGAVDMWSHTAPASFVEYFANRSPMLRMAHRSVRGAATRRTSNSLGLEKAISGNYTFGAGVLSSAQVADGLTYDTCLETITLANTTLTGQIVETATSVGGLGGLSVGAISTITQAGNAVVVVTGHGFEDNQLITIDNVVGMTEVNGREFYINKIDANNFSLRGEDSTGYNAYISGGTATAIASYAVMSISCKVMDGLENIETIRWTNNAAGRVGNIRTGALEEWVTSVCMIRMAEGGIGFANSVVQVNTTSGGTATVRFCDFQVAAFPTKQEASDFIHSGIFEYTA